MFAGAECSCSLKNQGKLNAKLALHFPKCKGLHKPLVRAFPEVLVCLNCGFAVFVLADAPLKELGQTYTDNDRPGTDNLVNREHMNRRNSHGDVLKRRPTLILTGF
jgi:hypothetical protein